MVELQKHEPLYGVCRYPIKSIVVLLKIVLLLLLIPLKKCNGCGLFGGKNVAVVE